MRALLFALALAACAPTPASCDLTATHRVAFTAPEAEDIVTVRTFGRSCSEAVVLFTITRGDGEAAWAWTATIPHAFADAMRPVSRVEMQALLERWATPRVERSASAPMWPLEAPDATTLDRATYEDIRARDLPMLCHVSGVARETCVFWEPAAGGAGLLLERAAPAPQLSEKTPT